MSSGNLLSVSDLAALLKVSTSTVRALVAKNTIPGRVRICDRVLFSADEVQRYIQERTDTAHRPSGASPASKRAA